MKVALLALSVRGAMGQYLEALVPHLAKRVETHLFVPVHFPGQLDPAFVHSFETGRNWVRAFFRLINPLLARSLWKKIYAIRPTLIHIFSGEGYPWILLISYWVCREKIPIFLTMHDPELHIGCSIWEYANGVLRRLIVPRAHSVHVHSKVFIKSAQNLGAHNVTVIPHGSIAERFTKHYCPDRRREPIALFFGRLEPYKGLGLLVEAGLKLQGKLRIVIAGPGRIPSKVRKVIQEHPEWFELRNCFISDEEVAELFQRASVLVLPYLQATQSSLPLIAAAFGVPVVSTAVGAFVEDVPRVGGILVPPGDASALANGMLEAIGTSPLYPTELEMSALSAKFVEWYRTGLERAIDHQ
ncbi:MAG: glycosyltransferase family 4 protein [Anaerolineales bacterium]|nr:glycosyltransferase family 4 protein [Anaerolineales bacterium]